MHGFYALILIFTSSTGVKMHSQNEAAFTGHMLSFIPHITEQSHEHCLHQPRAPKEPRVDPVEDREALEQLEALVQGYIDDCHRYIHGFSTIQLESLNGTACKRVDKERNWTIMYSALFNAGILECNKGMTTPVFSSLVHSDMMAFCR
jgi:hypothetical protein